MCSCGSHDRRACVEEFRKGGSSGEREVEREVFGSEYQTAEVGGGGAYLIQIHDSFRTFNQSNYFEGGL